MAGMRIGCYCIGHRPPVFQPPFPYTHVTPVACAPGPALVVPDDAFGPMLHGTILSEYTQLFGLAEHGLREPLDAVYLFQYRKFISLVPGGQVSPNQPYARAAPAEEAERLFPGPDDLARLGAGVLIGPAVRVRSIADQYARHHPVEDYAAFCAALASMQAFGSRRLAGFINGQVLLPAPSLGLFPLDLFLSHMQVLREAWETFAPRYYVARDGYQRRVGGFLLERLHSFLLTEAIAAGAMRPVQGHQMIVSDTAIIEPTI